MLLIAHPSNLLKLLLIILCGVTALVFAANQIGGEETAIILGNYLYIPIQITLLIISVWAIRHFGIDGIHGLGWLSFLGFVICWFAGDMTWTILEMILHVEPYPSVADLFYLPGYPFLLIFAVSYIVPFRDALSKKTVLASTVISAVIVSFSFSMIGFEGNIPTFDDAISFAYPIADGIILIPVLSGLFLFFKSKIDALWSLMLFGILATFVGDVLFAYLEYNDLYYTGHPMELAFYFSYILLIFGVIYHKKAMAKQQLDF